MDKFAAPVVLSMSLVLAAVAYFPGLNGSFVLDDYTNIVFNSDLRIDELSVKELAQAGWSGTAGPLKRPLAMVSYALNFSLTGDSAAGFKLTNLTIHLVNGILLFALLRLLLFAHRDRIIQNRLTVSLVAAAASGIWLVHPLNLTSILYVVQRMTSLAAMFSLAAMIFYCIGRRRLENNTPRAWLILCLVVPGFIVLAMLSKENAVLTLPLIALIEGCFFRLRTSGQRQRFLLIAMFVSVLVLPMLGILGYLIVNPDFLSNNFAGRSFTLIERLLTEARVLWFYLFLLLLPRLGHFGLHHDDYLLSTSLVEPATTAIAVVGIATAVIVSVITARRYPMFTFASGWFLISHALESSVIPLELVHEHRNYLPGMGIIFGCTYLARVLLHAHLGGRIQQFFAVAVISLCAMLTFIRAGHWGDPMTLAIVEVERHPNSYRAVYELGHRQYELYEKSGNEQDYYDALVSLERSAELDATAKRPLATLLKLEHNRGRKPKLSWQAELIRRYKGELFHPSDTRDLHELVRCTAQRSCVFPHDDIVALFHAALSNPTLHRYPKAQLMVDLAMYHVNQTGDIDRAIDLLARSVALFPTEFGFRKLLAQVNIMAGRFDEVAQEVEHMRSVRTWRDELYVPVDAIESIERDAADASRRLNQISED